jgi:phosphoribosyl 1,2-cyclic phosphodiesterase
LRVLASGSEGNCSILVFTAGPKRRACLIDAGLSPRRTLLLLERSGLCEDDIDCVLLTHLDHDHWHSGWVRRWPRRWLLCLSKQHGDHGRRRRLLPLDRLQIFDGAFFEVATGVRATPFTASHDDLGVASFRFDISTPDRSGSLGFATDLGRVPEGLVECFRGVDVLAIESNYCPRMQMASLRPEYLKRRIMGGSGHLSNEQAAEAVMAIEPRDHVVFLHLSRECNHPSLVASLHEGADYSVTITEQEVPSRWVEVRAGREGRAMQPAPRTGEQLEMFAAGAPRVT